MDSILLLSMLLIISIIVLVVECHGGQDEYVCGRQSCGNGLPIRFPFRLKDMEPPHCGYPGFDLSCSHNNETFFEISAVPHPIVFQVTRIEYQHNHFEVSDPEHCLPTKFLKLIKTSVSPFELDDRNLNGLSFFNCSPNSQFQSSCSVNVADDDDTLLDPTFVSCTKMFDISSSALPMAWSLHLNDLYLYWSKPNCSECERKGKLCKLKNNGTEGEVDVRTHEHQQRSSKSSEAAEAKGKQNLLTSSHCSQTLLQILQEPRTAALDQQQEENEFVSGSSKPSSFSLRWCMCLMKLKLRETKNNNTPYIDSLAITEVFGCS